MQKIDSTLPIEWYISQQTLPQAELDAWKALFDQSLNVTSSNSVDYNLNALSLTENLKPIYILGYFREINKHQLDNKQLKIAFILVKKKKSVMGIKFTLLQPVSHDHIDMMSILGSEYLNDTNCLTSLIIALNKKVKDWNLLSARRLRNINPFRHQLVSPTYQRYSAYFILQSDKKMKIEDVIPKKLYKNIKRFERKIEKEQQTKLGFLCYEKQEDVNSALSTFFKLEASGWKGKAGSAIMCNDTLKNFYSKSWCDFSRHDLARIYCLSLGDEVIAAGIAIQTNDEIILHKIAFNEKLAKFGPGSILVKHIIENAICEDLVSSICFNTNPPWLSRWHPKLYNLVALQIFNTNLKSRFISFLFKVADTLRIIKRKIKTM